MQANQNTIFPVQTNQNIVILAQANQNTAILVKTNQNTVLLVRANQNTVVLEETNQKIALLVRASQCPCEKVSWALLNIVLNESLDYHNINTLYFISPN